MKEREKGRPIHFKSKRLFPELRIAIRFSNDFGIEINEEKRAIFKFDLRRTATPPSCSISPGSFEEKNGRVRPISKMKNDQSGG